MGLRKIDYSKVPSKKFLAALKALRGKRCIITFHSLADLDACASALALAQHMGKKCIIAMQDRINSQSKRVLGEDAAKFFEFGRAIKKFPEAQIILLDCNDKMLLPKMQSQKVHILIDHHAKSANCINAKYEWVNPEFSSCSQMVSSLLKSADAKQAKILILGILADSANLLSADSDAFFQIARLLEICGEDFERLQSLLHAPRPAEGRVAVLEGLRNISFAKKGDVVCAIAQVCSCESHVADAFIRAGADGAFVGSGSKNSAKISARIRGRMEAHINLPALMDEVGKIIDGSGGGHPLAAGASGKNAQKLEEALNFAQKKFFEHTAPRIRITP